VELTREQIVMPEVVVVERLEESVRGAGGFGSTGGFGAGPAVNGV
jgi:dUTP pyrophosphatase